VAVTGTRSRRSGAAPDPDFLTASELAWHLGRVDVGMLDRWIAARTIPPPHAQPGPRTRLWLREHYDEFKRTGRWPAAAWPNYGREGA
jgi:hypothetical protein